MSRDLEKGARGQRGVAMLLVLLVLSIILFGGMAVMGVRVANLRGSREVLRGKMAYYCAEAGLDAGRDHFRGRAAHWQSDLVSGYTYQDQAAPAGEVRLRFTVRIRDNLDELPPLADDPNNDKDQTVILESTCTDPDLGTPITLTAVLAIVDSQGVHQQLGPTTYDKTFNSSPDPHGPCFSGNFPVDGDGGLQSGGGAFNPGGVMATGLDLRNDEIKLQTKRTTLPFIWMSNSGEGTISKLNTDTGVELGRYRTGPGDGNPSRTAVDLDGNVWVGNRGNNTVTKVGLKEAGNCIDRNGDGVVTTSTGGSDVKDWTGGWGAGVAGAVDECILLHLEIAAPNINTPSDIRLVAVDHDNNVFVGGVSGGHGVYKLRGNDGAILAAVNGAAGNYGGLVDPDGNVWVATDCSTTLVKYANDLSSRTVFTMPYIVYGLAMDQQRRLWVSECIGDHFMRMNLDGSGLVTFNRNTGGHGQGLAVDGNGHVWLAGSLYADYVDHYDGNGNLVATYRPPSGNTGVAVDHAGKIWSSNYGDGSATRIDPATGQLDTFAIGANPYNYSDMTGFILRNVTTRTGTWSVRQDGGAGCHHWKSISWNLSALPAGTTFAVRARSAQNNTQLGAAPWRDINNGEIIPANGSGLSGRLIEVRVTLTSTADNLTPVMDWITLTPW